MRQGRVRNVIDKPTDFFHAVILGEYTPDENPCYQYESGRIIFVFWTPNAWLMIQEDGGIWGTGHGYQRKDPMQVNATKKNIGQGGAMPWMMDTYTRSMVSKK